jgi:protein-disulfide isomerase
MKTEIQKPGGLIMPHRLLTAIFLVLCLAASAGSADGAHGLILSGSADSPVKIEVFSDFQCPACAHHFHHTIQRVLQNYKDRVGVVYYEFPMERHQYARLASRYVSAAARLEDQQKLLALFEALFADRDNWVKDGNLEASVARALSPEDFQKVKSVMETERDIIEEEINRSIREGINRDIPATPTIFISNAGKREIVVMPPNAKDMYTVLSWRLNGLLRQ